MDWPRAPSGSTCLGDGTVCGCVDAFQFEQNTIRSVHRFCITPLQKLAYDRHPSSCHHSSVSCSTTERAGRCWRPPSGRRGALRLGRPRESPAQGSLTSRAPLLRLACASPFPRRYPPPSLAIAIDRFRYARQADFSDVSQSSSSRRLRVTPQAMPQGGDSKRPHSLRFFAIAFEVRRRIPRRPLSEGACEAMG